MKRVFVILISICLIGCLLTGCGTKEDQYGNWADNHSDDFYHILNTSIVYAKDTKVIYIITLVVVQERAIWLHTITNMDSFVVMLMAKLRQLNK